MPKIRVLLVDDEPKFTHMLKLNLERRGDYEVRTETNGAYAVNAARDFRPDIIFLDVIMPDVDGGEVAARIKADKQLKDTPVVFLTAGVSKETTKARGDIIGGQRFLPKPVSVAEVLECIERILGVSGVAEPPGPPRPRDRK
jgi:two-component system OmpR family response regulator